MKIGIVQRSCGSDRSANIAGLTEMIRDCARQGAELVVLQELHNGLYFCQTEDPALFDQAEPIPVCRRCRDKYHRDPAFRAETLVRLGPLL